MASSVFDPSQYSNLREYVEAVQSMSKDATAEFTKAVEKATKNFKVAA